MTQHPFDEAYKKFKNIPLEELKRNNEAHAYGAKDTWEKKAVEYIIKEHEDAEQKMQIQRNFELTKSNVDETKKMAVQTRNLVFVTAGIAVVSFLGYLAQLKSVEFAQISENREKTRLQAELRPYLIIQLYPEPNKFGSQEYFKRDGNSQLYWEGLYNKIDLILPFKIKNVGKIPAVNIEAKYDSPSQSRVPIAMAYNNISPDEESSEFLHPWVNISTILNDNGTQQFDITLRITYKGLDEINSGNYCSLLKLTVMKKQNNIYQVIGNNFKFGCL
jgi:hypothetical protein